jgi:hypothetical protein
MSVRAPNLASLPDGYTIAAYGSGVWSAAARTQWRNAGLVDTVEGSYNYNVRGASITKYTDANPQIGAVLRSILPANTTGENPTTQRAEWQIPSLNGMLPGARKIIGFKVKTLNLTTGAFGVMTQFKNDGNGSPPAEIAVNSGEFASGGLWLGTTSAGAERYKLTDAVAGAFQTVICEILYGKGAGQGAIKLWLNPTSATAAPTVNDTSWLANDAGTGSPALGQGGTIWANRSSGYVKNGLYGTANRPTQREVHIAKLCDVDTFAEAFNFLVGTGTTPGPGPDPTPTPPEITQDLAAINEPMTSGFGIFRGVGDVTNTNGQAIFNVSPAAPTAELATERNVGVTGDGVIVKVANLPTIISGTGEAFAYVTVFLDEPGAFRAVLRYSVTELATTITMRIVENNVDSAPLTVTAPASIDSFKIGFLPDGKTVSFQYSTEAAPTVFKLLATGAQRAFPTATFNGACEVSTGLQLSAGSPVVGSFIVDSIVGTTNPSPSSSTGSALGRYARNFNAQAIKITTSGPTTEPMGFLMEFYATGTAEYDLMGLQQVDNTGGRGMKLKATTDPSVPNRLYYWDYNIGGLGAGVVPRSTPMLGFVGKKLNGQVTIRIANLTDRTFQHHPDIGAFAIGPTLDPGITPGERLILGAQRFGNTTSGLQGWAGFGATTNDVLTQAEFEALVETVAINGLYPVTKAAVDAVAKVVQHAPLDQATVGTAIVLSKGTGTEEGDTTTTVNDTGAGTEAIPYSAGTGTGTPPTGTSLPDPTGFVVTNPIVDPAAPTTGKATLTVDAHPGPNLHATPYVWEYSDASGAGPWTQIGSPTASPTLNVTGIPLDRDRWFTVRVRDNATPTKFSAQAPSKVVRIASGSPTTPPTTADELWGVLV